MTKNWRSSYSEPKSKSVLHSRLGQAVLLCPSCAVRTKPIPTTRSGRIWAPGQGFPLTKL